MVKPVVQVRGSDSQVELECILFCLTTLFDTYFRYVKKHISVTFPNTVLTFCVWVWE